MAGRGSANLRAVERGDRKRRINSSISYKVTGDGQVEVYDLDFAAYCLMRELVVADMIKTYQGKKQGPPRFLFLFQDEGTMPQLAVDYTNSESARHADCVRRMKKAIRTGNPKER